MAWLLTITRNLANSRLRERSRSFQIDPEEWQDQLAELPPEVTDDDRILLNALLGGLSSTDRQILTLHALSGLKHREIAALLELPLPTVLSKYHRAVKKIYHRAVKKIRAQWKETD